MTRIQDSKPSDPQNATVDDFDDKAVFLQSEIAWTIMGLEDW